jgi:hypothetical protein
MRAKTTGPRTPKRRKARDKTIIGSSSTWKEEELDRFKVDRVGNCDVKDMISEKWFDFSDLEGLESGISSKESAECSPKRALICSAERPSKQASNHRESALFLCPLLHPPAAG